MVVTLSKCFRCGSTAIKDRPVEELLRHGRYIVAMRVPANVCSACGERYFEKDDAAMFEDVRHRLAHGNLAGFRVIGEVLELVVASPR